jgi:hypothetical protein
MKTVIELAREAGFEQLDQDVMEWSCFDDELQRFASLVRADEREACAKVAQSTVCDTHIPTGVKIYGTAAAKAIRARGETK